MEVPAGLASGKGADMRFLRFIVLVLVVVLAMSTPVFAEPRAAAATAAEDGIFQSLWSFMIRLWSDEGCTMDPLGRCQQDAPTSDAGCVIDPLGGACQNATPTVDEGCVIDPLGRCATTQTQ
jgi:hypothetical protein